MIKWSPPASHSRHSGGIVFKSSNGGTQLIQPLQRPRLENRHAGNPCGGTGEAQVEKGETKENKKVGSQYSKDIPKVMAILKG